MIRLYDVRPSPEDEAAVLDALRSGRWADGPAARRFEQAFAALHEVPHAIAVANGTASLQALAACTLSPGNRVLTTPFTFIATANALRGCDAIPRFADVDPATGNMDPAAAEAALRRYPGTRAILLVHLYGCPCDMGAFTALARQYKVALLEDCAQAAGAAWHGRPVGGFGLAGSFSFYATKNLATGEGGMITTNDDDLAAALRRYVNHGRGKEPYEHVSVGFNLRMHGLAAALGESRLRRLTAENDLRRAHAAAYQAALSDLPWLALPPDTPGHVYHQYVLRTQHRDQLKAHLANGGVETAVYYPTVVYRQPAYAGWPAESCPNAERLSGEVLAIPIRPGLTLAERETVVAAIRSFQPSEGDPS